MNRVGIRELRASAAAAVRRAEGGQTTVITVGGRPVAQLGPLTSHGAERTLDELVAQGLLIAPRRAGASASASAESSRERTIQVWGTVRLDRLLREVRG
jgi:antitoxin (DNA-binding transcriptional repressor) of toxin-antitoxin stability system